MEHKIGEIPQYNFYSIKGLTKPVTLKVTLIEMDN